MEEVLKKILLVDDSPRDRELIKNTLAEYNLLNTIVELTDGAETLDYLYRRGQYAGRLEGHPVVILLDLKMPKLDGLEVLRIVKSDPLLKTIPVVVMTSSREEKDLIRSYELGANAYVVKPVEFQGFVDAAKQVGAFWALLNEPPPSCLGKEQQPRSAEH